MFGNHTPRLPTLFVPFDPVETYKDDARRISTGLRNADTAQSNGPLDLFITGC